MSVYLGQTPISVTDFIKANMYVDNRQIMQENIYSSWTRPQGWPDLDSLELEMSGQDSFVYMTYQTGHVDDVCQFYVQTASGTATVELGTIENGVFTASSTETVSSKTTKTYWFTSNEGYSEGTIVVKATGRFTRFYLSDVTRDSSLGGGTIKFYMQPMLERIWYIPELPYLYNGSSTSTTGNGTVSIQRDKIGNGAGTSLTSLTYGWAWCYNLRSLDISDLSTPNLTNMGATFMYCRKLEELDVSGLTVTKVTNMANMFDGCFRLKQLDLRNWNAAALTTTGLTYTFRYCYALKTIQGLENFTTTNINSLLQTFYSCFSLQDLSGITNWNVSNVTSLNSTFYNCFSLRLLNLSSWNIGKVTSIAALFYYCRTLEHIMFPQVQTGVLTGAQNQVFYGCYNLQEISLTWIRPLTAAVTSIGYMFAHCRSVSTLNIPEGWNISGCTGTDACLRIFADCYKLETITGISNWDMSGYNYSLAYSFEYDYCLRSIDIKNWKANPTSMYQAFQDCHSLQEIDLTGWGWNNMTSTACYQMFCNCFSLKTIRGIEHLGDAGNITSFASMFSGCYSLTSLSSISSWNVAKATTCATMFQNCASLQSLTITDWTLTKCTTIANMFRYCYGMRSLETTGWTIPALTANPDYIFCDMYSLIQCSGLPINRNHRYQNDVSLPEAQWERIFTQLPSVSSKTLYISSANTGRLTSTTKAIATGKGWTLAS